MKASDQASVCGAGERWRFEYASPSSSEPDGADAGVAVVALPSGIITAGMLDELRGGGGVSD